MDLMRLMSWGDFLERDPTQESCLGTADKGTSRKKWTAGKPEAEGYCNPFPNLTVKTTRINKYKHKVDI